LIHDQLAIVGNVGYLLSADAEPTLFHPGDSYTEAPAGVDVLAVPLSAPWAKLAETLAFVDRVRPGTAVPIHDAILAPNGRKVYMGHLSGYSPDGTEIRDLSDGTAATLD
jgi:L-ascorbate metabolism protein UlaG (beta-lactamase superfamily)